ncbi:hypothetical protein WA026_021317 [Henosepilachna vigintioctopunctata]|uniref:Uncharacterized protein n=1 Tax=Henosepilachna vigintioctopunctata TaxID=420089 RepID=A0AAW1UC73_9CUCU
MLGLPSYGQGWITQPWHKLGLSLAGPRLDYSALVHAWVTIVQAWVIVGMPRLDNPINGMAKAWPKLGLSLAWPFKGWFLTFSRPGPSMVNQWHGQGWVKRSGPRVALYRYAKARLPSTGPGSAPLSALGNSCMGFV